jgi:hypothetical protein
MGRETGSGGGGSVIPSAPILPVTGEWKDTGRINWDGKKIWTRLYQESHPGTSGYSGGVDHPILIYTPTNVHEIVKTIGSWGFTSEFQWGGTPSFIFPIGQYIEYLEGWNTSSGIPMRRICSAAAIMQIQGVPYQMEVRLQIGDTQDYIVTNLWCKCCIEITTIDNMFPNSNG